MKILIFSSLSARTGCWVRAGYIANSLRRGGADVTLFKPLPQMPFFLDMILSIPLNIFRVLLHRTDVVIGLKPFPNTTLPLMVSKILGRFVIVDIDDLDYEYRTGMLRNIVKYVQCFTPKHCDLVTYHNEMLATEILDTFKVNQAKMYRMQQGVDLQVFNIDTHNTTTIQRKLVDDHRLKNKTVLMYTAHLNAGSDLEIVLRAIQTLYISFPAIKLLVIGGGSKEKQYRALANELHIDEHVVFTGYKQCTDIANYLRIADICLLYYRPSKVNNYRCSMKLREYLAMKKSVVCNPAGELASFKDFTIQSTDSTIQAYADAIEAAMTHPCETATQNGYEYAKHNFDWNSIASRLLTEINARITK